MKEKDKYSIGDVEEICNVQIRTLRYYDKIKLVVPKFRDEGSNYRYYSKEQMVTIFIVRKLRAMGFALNEIQEIVHGNSVDSLEKSIAKKLIEFSDEIRLLQEKYADGHAFLQRLKKGVDILSYRASEDLSTDRLCSVCLENISECDLFFSRRIMERYCNSEVSLDRWVEIIEKSIEKKMKTKGTIVVTYYTNLLEQFFFKDCDIEFGIEVENPENSSDFRRFGGFLAATAIHIGNYGEIMKTHLEIIQWINKNGYKVCGPASEEFIISPVDINNSEEQITKIIIPVEKASIEKNKY